MSNHFNQARLEQMQDKWEELIEEFVDEVRKADSDLLSLDAQIELPNLFIQFMTRRGD